MVRWVGYLKKKEGRKERLKEEGAKRKKEKNVTWDPFKPFKGSLLMLCMSAPPKMAKETNLPLS